MIFYDIFVGILGLIGLFAMVFVFIGGIARLRGRRSRFDRLADLLSSAYAKSVYPPSLRGGGTVVPPSPGPTKPIRHRRHQGPRSGR